MCGEHPSVLPGMTRYRGSSPHVRGAPDLRGKRVDDVGIIPACAGSTFQTLFELILYGDHPRMCGEHTSKIA